MSDNPCASAVSTFPPGPTTEQEFATLTASLVDKHSDAIAQQLKAMGVQSCKTTSDSTSGASKVCTWLGCGAASAANDYQTSVGCEQLSLQSQLNVALNSSTSCALNSAVNNTSVSTYQANQIQIKLVNVQLTGDLNITGNQVNQIAGTVVNFSDTSTQSLITNTMQNTVKNFADSLQGTANTAFSSPTSQKSISDQVTAIQNVAQNDTIQKTVQSTISDVVQQNGTLITVDGATANSLNINLAQLNVNNFVVQSIAKNVLAATFSTDIANDIANSSTVSQSQANTGPVHATADASGGGGFIILRLILMIIWFGFLFFIFYILYKVFRGGFSLLSGTGGGKTLRNLFITDGVMFLLGILMIIFGAGGFGIFLLIFSIIIFFVAIYVYYQYKRATAMANLLGGGGAAGTAVKALGSKDVASLASGTKEAIAAMIEKAKKQGNYQELMKKATSGGALDFRKLLQSASASQQQKKNKK